ncbi:MAG TPA: NAD(P)-dependent oxidoreductase [Armatimonadota bacterium]
MLKLLHIAAGKPNGAVWTEVFRAALKQFGELEIVENGDAMPKEARAERARACDVLFTSWSAASVPAELAENPGRLRYVCHVTGGLRGTVPEELIDSAIPVTNWGDAPSNGVAEGAMALLLAALKDLHHQIRLAEAGEWAKDLRSTGGSIDGLNVGLYGCGAIGRRFVELLRPFHPVIRVYDPFADGVPEGCARVNSLEELFGQSEAVAIHAGLCDGTRNSVRAEHLALLPRHGVIVNTARGAIIEPEALLCELQSGRLRAGLDVTDPEPLPPGHPLRTLPNVILTCHRVEHGWPLDGQPPRNLTRMQNVCLENVRRFCAGEPLLWVMDRRRYDLST